jgi:hypothetical protein
MLHYNSHLQAYKPICAALLLNMSAGTHGAIVQQIGHDIVLLTIQA